MTGSRAFLVAVVAVAYPTNVLWQRGWGGVYLDKSVVYCQPWENISLTHTSTHSYVHFIVPN